MNPHLPSPEAHDEALAQRLFAATQPVLRRRRGVRMAGRMAIAGVDLCHRALRGPGAGGDDDR